MPIHFTWFANIFQTTLPKNPNPSQKILPLIDPFHNSLKMNQSWTKVVSIESPTLLSINYKRTWLSFLHRKNCLPLIHRATSYPQTPTKLCNESHKWANKPQASHRFLLPKIQKNMFTKCHTFTMLTIIVPKSCCNSIMLLLQLDIHTCSWWVNEQSTQRLRDKALLFLIP
jgi:hypothetical protein